jgi:hypothetical protein
LPGKGLTNFQIVSTKPAAKLKIEDKGACTMKKCVNAKTIFCFLCFLIASMILPFTRVAAETAGLSKGQTLYIPIYSHIYSGLKARPFDLAATLSIRNTDPKYAIMIISVAYYDTGGRLIKEYLDAPVSLDALATNRYIISEGDKSGGSGANFIVKWSSDKLVNPPLTEGVMIGTRSGQGISFVSRGQVIIEHSEK